MIMKRRQQGMTIIETLGALAIATTLLLGLSTMIDTALDDAKGQQAAQHQGQVVAAANKYLSANYAALVASTDGGSLATVTLAQLKTARFLPDGFAAANGFGQAACVLVRQATTGKLDVLVATYGGKPIPERDIALAAMLAGQGGGYISAAAPGIARGASWQMATTGYRSATCGGAGAPVLTGTAANDGGHLVSSLFYDGPGQLAGDFLYRKEVLGRPELNQMNAPIHMAGSGAQAVRDDATDPRCTPGSGTGKIAVDATGKVLSCQGGVWKGQGSGSWKEPVALYADLPASDNEAGDVRMVSGLSRGFTWSGTRWEALAVDEKGNFLVPGTATVDLVKLERKVEKNAPCSDNGTIAADETGLALSCQSGFWRSPKGIRLTNRVYQRGWELNPPDALQNVTVDLASLPGPRPLYLTGYATCHATGTAIAQVSVDMVDASGATLAYAGGCLSQLDSSGSGVQNLGDIGLQKIPENITQLRLHIDPGVAPGDYITFLLSIYSE